MQEQESRSAAQQSRPAAAQESRVPAAKESRATTAQNLLMQRQGAASGNEGVGCSGSRFADSTLTDSEMERFMQFYMKMEKARSRCDAQKESSAPQYQNLSNVNIFNISNSNHVGNLLSDEPILRKGGVKVITAHGDEAMAPRVSELD